VRDEAEAEGHGTAEQADHDDEPLPRDMIT
jgi:hypothetical protein